MANLVFVLGAGASRLAGGPLVADFLDMAHDLYRGGKADGAENDFKKVFEGISELQRVHSKAQLDIQNFESVFAAFEMARTLGGFARYGAEDTVDLLRALRSVIVNTLEHTIQFGLGRGPRILPPPPYAEFGALLRACREDATPRQSVAAITFNYDLGVDYGLLWNGLQVDYGLGDSVTDMPLLKLHGSLNWARCSKCSGVVPWMLKDYWSTHSVPHFRDRGSIRVPVASQLSAFRHCGEAVIAEPILVPPTWNKTGYYSELAFRGFSASACSVKS